MFNDKISVTGEVDIKKFNEAGELTEHRIIPNLVVNIGKNYIAGRMSGLPPTVMTHMALGAPSSSVAVLLSDTSLTTEIARVAVAIPGGTQVGSAVAFTATFPAGIGTNTSITEAGIFSASTFGNMLARTIFTAVNKLTTDTIVISWTITIS